MSYSDKISLSFLGITHALVDAATVSVVFAAQKISPISLAGLVSLALLYNILAFGLQVLFGYFSDKWQMAKQTTVLGFLAAAISVLLVHSNPLLAVICAGIGNALFHVGGGSISLNYQPGRATVPGIFVAPGALGLTLGILIGKGNFLAWPFLFLILLSIIVIYFLKFPKINYAKKALETKVGYLQFGVLLLLFSVAIRSLVGTALVFPWKTDFSLLITLTLAVVAGKALGGFLADKFGWLRTALSALIISIPLITLGAEIPTLAILGIFLFNMTMPITLVAIASAFPGRPGFAFGLTCFALLIGSLPALSPAIIMLGTFPAILLLVLSSAVMIYSGLTLFYRYKITPNNN